MLYNFLSELFDCLSEALLPFHKSSPRVMINWLSLRRCYRHSRQLINLGQISRYIICLYDEILLVIDSNIQYKETLKIIQEARILISIPINLNL